MNRLIPCLALVLSLLPAAASAQVEASIHIGLPVAPPLVVVQPGLQVVENSGEEVFLVGGWYWCRRGDSWYRARRPYASFIYVEPQRVPNRLAYLPPPGHYKHWNRGQLGAERHWWREHDRDRRRAWRQHEQADHRGWRGNEGPGRVSHGHGPSGSGAAPRPLLGREVSSPAPTAHRGGPAPLVSRGAPAPAPAVHRGGPTALVNRGGPSAAPAPSRGGHGHDGRDGHRD